MSTDNDRQKKILERQLESLGEMKTPIPEVYVVKPDQSKRSVFLYLPLSLLAIVLLGFALKFSFSWLGFERYSSADLYLKLNDPRTDIRRMAAVDWAQQLSHADQSENIFDKDALQKIQPNLSETLKIGALLNETLQTPTPDPSFVSALASVLSFSVDKEAARKGLLEALTKTDVNQMSELQFFIFLGLARTGLGGDSAEDQTLFPHLKSNDEGVRKALAFALGQTQNPSSERKDLLAALLTDSNPEVGVNAALAMGRLKDSRAYPSLQALLQEILSQGNAALKPEKLSLYLQTISVLGDLKDPSFQSGIEQIAKSHPNLKLRQAAKVAVQ